MGEVDSHSLAVNTGQRGGIAVIETGEEIATVIGEDEGARARAGGEIDRTGPDRVAVLVEEKTTERQNAGDEEPSRSRSAMIFTTFTMSLHATMMRPMLYCETHTEHSMRSGCIK